MLEAIFGSKQQTDTFLMFFPLDQQVTKNQILNSGVYFYVVITIEKRRESLASSFFDWDNKIKVNNVCLIKIHSKHNSNTLLHLLHFFMRQTLPDGI